MIPASEIKNQDCCSLCEQPVSDQSAFCCKGCEAVYEILSQQNSLEKRGEHPLYLQAVKYGVISNPDLKIKTGSIGKERYAFEIRGMWCPACASLIALLLSGMKGVIACKVDYMTDFAAVEYDPMQVSKEEMRKKIESFGYQTLELNDPQRKKREFTLTLRLAVAFFCTMNVMMFTYPLYGTFFDFDSEQMAPLLAWLSLILTIPVVTYSALPIYRRFALSLQQGRPGMETLVVIGLFASLAVSLYEILWGNYHVYFDTATMLVTLVLLGRLIEQTAKFSAKEAWYQLHRSLPTKARRATGEIVPLKEIVEGDQLILLQGEKVPLDGIVLEGEGACDESSLTGEPLPIPKSIGDSLISGSLVQSGLLRYKAVTTFEKSSIRHLLDSVQKDLSHKTESMTTADQAASFFTPLVVAIALAALPVLMALGLSFPDAFIRSLTVLLIACPCAIGIAAPFVESRLIQCFAERGAIVRNRTLFKRLPKATLYAFDKTGTLTEGTLQLVKGLNELNSPSRIAIQSLALQSNHPMAKACQQQAGPTAVIKDFKEVPGRGMEGSVQGKHYLMGSRSFLQEKGVFVPPLVTSNSAAFIAENGNYLTTLEFTDRLREGAESLPFKRIILSGDRQEAVSAIAHQLNFPAFQAEMKPEDKKQWIKKAQARGETVVFVGDGMNDAPALTAADVGISLVSAADISFHVSDLYLISGKLDQFQVLHQLSLKGQSLIRQNFFWAFFYNGLGIPLALFGILSPLFATFAMALSSLIVLLNSKRLHIHLRDAVPSDLT